MTISAPSNFPVPSLDEMPADLRERITLVSEKIGFIPNVFLALAHRPDEFRAFFAYHDALMERDSGLSKAEREMIVVATSGQNQCLYCVVAHGAILRIREKNSLLADQLATNYRKAAISERQKAMLDYAMKVSRNSHSLEEKDKLILKNHSFNEDDIWDIAAISAFFALSNRLANMAGISPNEEFYAMGREIPSD